MCECEEKDVPIFWRAQENSSQPKDFSHKVVSSKDKFATTFTDNIFSSASFGQEKKAVIDCPQNDKEWCVDDQDGTYEKINESDYMLVNLLDNEEAYTAYEGGPIWNSIYEENCLLDKAFSNLKHRLKHKIFKLLDHEDYCTEETLLYHMISGLHASVNTHISEGFSDLKNPGNNVANQTFFLDHVGNHLDRVKNLHFVFAAAVKAV